MNPHLRPLRHLPSPPNRWLCWRSEHACAPERSIQRLVCVHDQTIEPLEVQAARDGQELLRLSLQCGAQAKADATTTHLSCLRPSLSRRSSSHARPIQARDTAVRTPCGANPISDLCKSPNSNGARSIAPPVGWKIRAEQCSALPQLTAFAEISISIGQCYHVAASYDRSSLINVPVFYINGVKYPSHTIAMPVGNPTSTGGTGYIGNNSSNNRNWNDLTDGLRIYDRVLNDTEVAALAASAPDNLAPSVSAGTNQNIVWSAAASLNGLGSDDGNPNPPDAVSVAWSQISRPGTISFFSSNAVAATASFSEPGDYGLQLAASDGQVQTASSRVVRVVNRPLIAFEKLGQMLRLSWPVNGGPWRLQTQRNALSDGPGTNWVDVPDSSGTNQISFPMHAEAAAMFYRQGAQ